MFLHHVNNIEHNIKKYLYWHGSNPSYNSMILYIKTDTLKNDASSETANFISEVSTFLKMKILNFIFLIIDRSTCDQLLP